MVHDERRPFVVPAGDLVAKDRGTEFTVRAYPEDVGARVVVREGKVAIRAAAEGAGGPERAAAPGQLGRSGGRGSQQSSRRTPPAACFRALDLRGGWSSRTLRFARR